MTVRDILLAAGQVPTYWVDQIDASGASLALVAMAVVRDSSGNFIMLARHGDQTPPATAYLVRLSPSGQILAQAEISGVTGLARMVIDASDNLYLCGYSSATAASVAVLMKLSHAFAILWQTQLSSANGVGFAGLVLDSAGNPCVCGFAGNGTDMDMLFAKYSAAGALQWQTIVGGAGNQFGQAIGIDAADNLYGIGEDNSGSSYASAHPLVKVSSAGALVWQTQHTLGSGPSNESGGAVALDGAGNIYVARSCIETVHALQYDGYLAKYNSAGVLQWINQYQDQSVANLYLGAVRVGADGYVYAAGSYGGGLLVLRSDSGGFTQWSGRIPFTSAESHACLLIDAAGALVVGSGVNTAACIARINSNGEVKNANSPQPVSMTVTAGVGTDGASTYTASAGALTVGAPAASIVACALSAVQHVIT